MENLTSIPAALEHNRPPHSSHAVVDEVKHYDEALIAQRITLGHQSVMAVERGGKLTSRWGAIKTDRK